MRIGIVGAGGAGKTTLANFLFSQLEIPLVVEGTREWLAARGVSPWKLSLQEQSDMQAWFFENKAHQEAARSSFVSDRTVLDSVVLSRIRGLSLKRKDFFADLEERAIGHARESYDLIILRPTGIFPLQGDGVRTLLRNLCLLEEIMIAELVQKLRLPLLRVSDKSLNDALGKITRYMDSSLKWV